MDRRYITEETYEKVIKKIPQKIINMLPNTPKKLLKYATRTCEIKYSKDINEETKELMKKYLLSDEEYLITFYFVMAITFYNKFPVNNPKLNIVSAQTGSGKSNLTAQILRKDANYIFVDSDKYKHFRYNAIEISKKYPTKYAFLTAPDCYDHAINIYEYAINNKYNIIKEVAPSSGKELIEKDISNLEKNRYEISLSILAVSAINSILSMHERYEQQLLCGLKTAKLTGTARHNESYEALINNVLNFEKKFGKNMIKVYRRGNLKNNFYPHLIYPNNRYNSVIEAIQNERFIDYLETLCTFNERYNLLDQQMEDRQAVNEQREQLYSLKNDLECESALKIIEANLAKLTIQYSTQKSDTKHIKDKINLLCKIKEYVLKGDTQMIKKILSSKSKGVL